MRAAINDVDFDVDHRIAAEHAVEHRLLDPFLDRRDVFPRNDAADDFVLNDKSLAAFGRPHIHFDVSVLTATAGLFDQLADAMGGSSNRLAVSDLRLAGIPL